MVRIFLAVAMVASGVAPTALADSSVVSAAFGNTIVSTYPDGRRAELWLQADGSYTAEGRRHDPSRGHWRVSGGKLCLRQARPVPMLFSFCTPIPRHGMEVGWPAKAATGEPITVSLVRGRGSRADKGA